LTLIGYWNLEVPNVIELMSRDPTVSGSAAAGSRHNSRFFTRSLTQSLRDRRRQLVHSRPLASNARNHMDGHQGTGRLRTVGVVLATMTGTAAAMAVSNSCGTVENACAQDCPAGPQGPPGPPADTSMLATLATPQTFTAEKTFTAGLTFGGRTIDRVTQCSSGGPASGTTANFYHHWIAADCDNGLPEGTCIGLLSAGAHCGADADWRVMLPGEIGPGGIAVNGGMEWWTQGACAFLVIRAVYFCDAPG
jgi:hypothetical protein